MVEAFPISRSIQHSGDSHWFSPTFINTVKLRFVTTASVLLRLLCCCDLTRKGFRERFVEAPHPQTWLHANGRVNVLWAFFGVLMWWQIKATRRCGNAILILKAVAAAESKMGTVIVGC